MSLAAPRRPARATAAPPPCTAPAASKSLQDWSTWELHSPPESQPEPAAPAECPRKLPCHPHTRFHFHRLHLRLGLNLRHVELGSIQLHLRQLRLLDLRRRRKLHLHGRRRRRSRKNQLRLLKLLRLYHPLGGHADIKNERQNRQV